MRPIHPWKAWMVTVLLSGMCLGHVLSLLSQHCPDSTKKMSPGRWRPRTGATTTTTTTALACATNRRDNHLDDVRSLLAAALAKMKIVQEEEERFFFQPSLSSSSLKAFGQQMRDAVEARESSIPNAGQGLFARQKIKAGTIVSLYPVHCLGVEFVEDTDDDDLDDHSTVLRCYLDESDERYFDQQQQNSVDDDDDNGAYLQFLLGSRPLLNTSVTGALLRGMPLFVDVNPQRCEDNTTSCFLAHLVNDGSTVLHASEQGLLDYYVTSRQRKNCVFIPFGPAPILALVTTCPVRRGDELWTSYGANYWLDRLLAHGDENQDEDNLVTDRVLALVRENARDILTSLRAAEATHGDQLAALTRAYEAL
jgi:hypothetical protein